MAFAYETLLTYLGTAVAAWYALKFLSFVYQYYIMNNNLSKYRKHGGWAVITGASDGIGKAMSVELSKRGFNVCLISRTKSKLDEVATAITEKSKVQTKTIAFDFSNATDADYARLFKELDQIPIGVLVNNVGINYDFPQDIDEADVSLDVSLVKVNIESQIRMTKYVVPRMKEKRIGAILNLSSLSCTIATPMLATYAGTKSFNLAFSESLSVELKPFGIDVTAVTPGFVCSNMTGRKRASFDCPAAAAMARQTLAQLGGTTVTWGHRHHGIIGNVLTSLPSFILDGQVLKTNKVVRSKALKKRAEKAAAASQ